MSDSERSNALEWFSAGISNEFRQTREVLVRVWRPGDGLTCGFTGYQRSHPCAAPVAVIKDVLLSERTAHDRTVINRVVCIRHLGKVFGAEAAAVQEHANDRAALEELAQRHWDEYVQILTEARDALLRERLSALPEELRDQVIEVMKANDSGGDQR